MTVLSPDTVLSILSAPNTVIAVVGATDNQRKFGYAIYRDLKRKGYKAYAVNPNRTSVDGDPAYPDLARLHGKPDLVNFVVPPEVTLSVLKQCLDLGLKNVWLQPGAESPEVLEFLSAHGFNYLVNTCIMVESRIKRLT
ncbi:CoA-binding protein [Methylocaldum szegediense]|uniref:CoA_binding domain-containing protein n=1 Tax=Methylocaldum szegediense TaxID=73780 RepID=A0ABN8XAW9_9GAMM|nr:CoA-binding protein [Methylocaldum szegediense]CAI8928463.1 CoA_binding domain-containing protein [Methylocaldum szegediense]